MARGGPLGPSVTARRVAAYRLGFTRVPAPYGDAAADEALAADVAAGEQPGTGRMRGHIETRTRFFDRVVVEALGHGVGQVVLGAAGYDGRPLRYAKPGVRWFEVDQPATQQDKRERLDRLGLASAQVQFVEADFAADPVADRLTAAGLDRGQRTLFLLEGVAVYLELPVLDRVLREFRQVGRDGSLLAVSVSTTGSGGRTRARFQASVAAWGEPSRNTLDADQATGVLARAGWRVTAGDSDTGRDSDADADDPEAQGRRERRRAAGLLLATTAPVPADTPAQPHEPQPASIATQPARSTPPTRSTPPARDARPAAKTRPARQPQPVPPSTGPLSLSALLSQTLVAFTIELDNEAEHRLPHRTTDHGAAAQGGGAWLVSWAMAENCLRFVSDQPVTVAELEALARTPTNLDGMRRWGYITIDGSAQKTYRGRPGPGAVLRATARGLRARDTWLPLPGLIEQRWRERYGADAISGLRGPLEQLAGQLDPGLPDVLPILGPELFSRGPAAGLPPRPEPPDAAALPLPALLSRALLAFALEYEAESAVSLAVGANLLRVLGPDPTRPRDLPLLTGISKEAVNWALGVLLRGRLAAEEPDPAARRGKVLRLTAAGERARRLYLGRLAKVEDRWSQAYDQVAALRRPAEELAIGTDGQPPLLFQALEPYPDNWRASLRPPGTLPHYPMVLHRGGYPDGS